MVDFVGAVFDGFYIFGLVGGDAFGDAHGDIEHVFDRVGALYKQFGEMELVTRLHLVGKVGDVEVARLVLACHTSVGVGGGAGYAVLGEPVALLAVGLGAVGAVGFALSSQELDSAGSEGFLQSFFGRKLEGFDNGVGAYFHLCGVGGLGTAGDVGGVGRFRVGVCESGASCKEES